MPSIERRGGKFRARLMRNGVRKSRTFRTEAEANAWVEREQGIAPGVPALKMALRDHKIVRHVPPRLLDAIDKVNHSHDEILAAKFSLCGGCGIYFLIRDHEIRYVGQCSNLINRLDRHRRNGKKFDSFSFIPCSPEHLDELESAYISLLMPRENFKL